MLTSLKVVNIAVSFFTVTRRFAIVLRKELIFSRRSTRSPVLTGAVGATAGEETILASVLAGAFCAFSASSFVIRPSFPVPFIEEGSIPFSLKIFAAAGEAVPAA